MNTAGWVIVDTGVWSAFFSKPGSGEKRAVDHLLDEDRVALTGPVLARFSGDFVAATKPTGWLRGFV